MEAVYVVTDGKQYLDWDDHGAMSTGYPYWGDLRHARQYIGRHLAEKAAAAAWNCDRDKTLWIVPVEFTVGPRTRYVPVEQDPEWSEYQRLQEKFKGRA